MNTSFIIHHDSEEQINLLSDVQAGILLKSLIAYSARKEIVSTNDVVVKIAFNSIRTQMDIDQAKYKARLLRKELKKAKGGDK